MDQSLYSNDTLHQKIHLSQIEQPKRKKYSKKKPDSKTTKQAQEPIVDGPASGIKLFIF